MTAMAAKGFVFPELERKAADAGNAPPRVVLT